MSHLELFSEGLEPCKNDAEGCRFRDSHSENRGYEEGRRYGGGVRGVWLAATALVVGMASGYALSCGAASDGDTTIGLNGKDGRGVPHEISAQLSPDDQIKYQAASGQVIVRVVNEGTQERIKVTFPDELPVTAGAGTEVTSNGGSSGLASVSTKLNGNQQSLEVGHGKNGVCIEFEGDNLPDGSVDVSIESGSCPEPPQG